MRGELREWPDLDQRAFRIRATWSPRIAASSRSWVTSTTVVPSARKTRTSSPWSSPRVTGSSAPAARPGAPPREPGTGPASGSPAAAAHPTAAPASGRGAPARACTRPASSASLRARQSAGRRSARERRVTLSAAVRCGKSPPDWSPNPIRRRSAGPVSGVTAAPSRRISPCPARGGRPSTGATCSSRSRSRRGAPWSGRAARRATAGAPPDGLRSSAPRRAAPAPVRRRVPGAWPALGWTLAPGRALYASPIPGASRTRVTWAGTSATARLRRSRRLSAPRSAR